MDFRAKLSNYRSSPRKARLVAREMVGLLAEDCVANLKNSPRKTSKAFLKLVVSAMANAEEYRQGRLDAALLVSRVTVDPGPVMKRFRAMTMGRGGAIRKRTSHLTVVLTEVEG